MTNPKWPLFALVAIALGCGSATSQRNVADTTSSAPARQDTRPVTERLTKVRQLAVAGRDAEGVAAALVEALDDEDDTVKKVAAVALLSFGEKALPALRKKMPPPDPTPSNSKIPNPQKAPDEFLGIAELIVYHDPWFAGMLLPAAEEVAQDKDPALRVVGVRALAVGADRQPERIRKVLRAAEKDPDERVRQAAGELLKRLGN
jgi:HEAT repeat protein